MALLTVALLTMAAYDQVSHVIHSLSFGVHYPSRVNPLDGSQAILKDGSGVFQYFVKVVPTAYEFAGGPSLDSCQARK